MNLNYTNHAGLQMEKRGVTKADVETAIKRETRRTPGIPGSIWIWGFSAGGRVLKVCVDVADPDKVITVAWPD